MGIRILKRSTDYLLQHTSQLFLQVPQIGNRVLAFVLASFHVTIEQRKFSANQDVNDQSLTKNTLPSQWKTSNRTDLMISCTTLYKHMSCKWSWNLCTCLFKTLRKSWCHFFGVWPTSLSFENRLGGTLFQSGRHNPEPFQTDPQRTFLF